VSAALKERYSDGMSLAEAFSAALDALSAPGNGGSNEITASQLEVAILDRTRDHRTFRRVRAARLEELIGESRAIAAPDAPGDASDAAGTTPTGTTPTGTAPGAGTADPAGSGSGPSADPADSGPPTGPDPSSSDRGSGLGGPPL
jgi:proteasome alpha subunit